MAGFALPKLRWLVVGAVGAGIWAMTQEPPSPRKTQTTHRPATSVQRKAEAPSAPKQVVPPSTPKQIVPPVSRPSQIVTSSVARPERPVVQERPVDNSLYTTTRVNVRATAKADASVVATLNPGEAVKPIVRDGKWQLVSVRGRKGWIPADYLRPASPQAPRPAATVPGPAPKGSGLTARVEPPAPVKSQAYASPRPESTSLISKARVLFGERRPSRAPQAGDCQCPYDLMINGSQCGDRSAYSRRSRKNVQCYL